MREILGRLRDQLRRIDGKPAPEARRWETINHRRCATAPHRSPVKRTILSVPAHVAVRRYGPVAAGIGATAATFSLVTD
jgi:hypothetical protein